MSLFSRCISSLTGPERPAQKFAESPRKSLRAQSATARFSERRQNKLCSKRHSLNTSNKTQTNTARAWWEAPWEKISRHRFLWHSCWGEELGGLSASPGPNSTTHPRRTSDWFLVHLTALLISSSILEKQQPIYSFHLALMKWNSDAANQR